MGSVCAKRGGIDARRKGIGRGGVAARALAAGLLAAAAGALAAGPARAQGGGALPPTSPTIDCPSPEGQDLIMPPEIVSSGGVLRGTIVVTEESQRLPLSIMGQSPTPTRCFPQWVRVFRGKDATGADLPAPPAALPANALHPDPVPGPTLRAAVGDLVEIALINQVDSNRFDRNLDIEACTEVGQDGSVYPGKAPPGDAPARFDTYPNCLHASSTSNLHFHGTHTSPSTTGDNVYLQVRPLPRDNQGNLTTKPEEATVGFDTFFENCSQQLTAPLVRWPATWADLPDAWTAKQTELLQAYEAARPDQPLWTEDEAVLNAGGWPQYYVGAVPYCFALPAYTETVFPPPPGSSSPTMGQAPGTHWYHAHKHGSTAINVANGMTGAFIIEGDYDAYLDANYGSYTLDGGAAWTARSQPVMVLNQLGTTPNLLANAPGGVIDFVVNGRLRPIVHMQPGEVQLWRILNTSGRSAAYFMPPQGLAWRQLAQDGVQLHNANYLASANRPFYMAPANRVDLLVQAPLTPATATIPIMIQNVMARSSVLPGPEPQNQAVLFTVQVSGDPVQRYGSDAQMPFLKRAAPLPPYLADITDAELARSNYATKSLTFDSKAPQRHQQHTINGVQFSNGSAEVNVVLASTEEWTVSNTTRAPQIDHPFHIHINPFQITEVFDPNENLEDPATGLLLADAAGKAVPRYVTDAAILTDPTNPFRDRQCFLDPANEATWSVEGACGPQPAPSNLVWWDTFAIPSARADAPIPGYFKMRSRFVDYPGVYVLHCHILIHEDRGMMFSVEVIESTPLLVQHH